MLGNFIKNINQNFFLEYLKELINTYGQEIENFYIPNIKIEPKNTSLLKKRNMPILIVFGKIDSFSPEDSIITFVKNYGLEVNCKVNTKLNPCHFYIETSRANFFDKDYNHLNMFLYKNI